MKMSGYNVCTAIFVSALALLFIAVTGAPMEVDDEQAENTIMAHPDGDMALPGSWDGINTAALRKLLMQLDTEDRMGRVSRSWPQAEPRGWGLRNIDGRMAREWRADKRQVRFRQCYFNPISCFRK